MSLELNDQQALQVVQHLYKMMEGEQNQKLIDIDHLDSFKRRQIKPLYPHKFKTQDGVKKLQKYNCNEICCKLSSGSTCCGCCCKIKPPDRVYQQFGLGANIYFNFMKHFSFCFIFLAVFSVFAVGICYYLAVSSDSSPMSNYQVFLFSTTMGSFSSSYFRCKYSINMQTPPNYEYMINLNCPAGEIYQYGAVMSQNSQQSVLNCKLQRQKYDSRAQNYYLDSSQYTLVKDAGCNTKSCKLTLTFATNPATLTNATILSYAYACRDPFYIFSGTNIPIRIFTYVVVGIDLFITLGFLFFLCSQIDGQDDQIDYFKNYQLSLKDFSIKIDGFNSQTFDQEFQQLVSTIDKRESQFDQRIVQIKTPDDQSYLQMGRISNQKYQQLFEFMERNFFDSCINPRQYRNPSEFIENTFNSIDNYIAFKKQLIQLLQEFRNSRQLKQKEPKNMSIYLVLNSSFDVSALKRLQTKSCCSQYLVSNNKKRYYLDEAPIPDTILWQNRTKNTFLRVVISWLITLAIVAGSYILFGYIQWQQKKLLSNYNFSINCNLFYTQVDYTTFSTTKYNLNNQQYTHCYCSNNFFSLNFSDEVVSHCSAWRNSYILYLIIPILISIGLVIYNLIVSQIFKKLTQFQGHFFLTDQLFSYVIKRAFILIMNMGLIIVLINFNYKGQIKLQSLQFLFQGQYKDLSSDWYIKIGSIIIMTMIFNISFPFMQLIIASGYKCLKKCIDKRCWTRKTSQKYKSDYINLYSDDVYPIEQRYALIISIFWITMIFNCVIPLLNVIAALSFLLLQLIDKVLVFKFFKTPLNFDQSLHKRFMRALYISLIIHMISTAFLLSQPNLVPKNSSFSDVSSLSSNNQRLNTIIQTYYIIPYVALLVILICYALFKSTIIGLLSGCNKKIQRQSIYKIRNAQNFYQSLSQYQLFRLKIMTEKQINRLQTLRRQKLHSQNLRTDYSEMYINPKTALEASNLNIQIKIFRRTHQQILKYMDVHRKQEVQRKAKLIGLPGYQLSVNQHESQKQKKILLIDTVLQQILRARK